VKTTRHARPQFYGHVILDHLISKVASFPQHYEFSFSFYF
jgi:hypothetical protein